jgi:6-phosphogluconolactonase
MKKRVLIFVLLVSAMCLLTVSAFAAASTKSTPGKTVVYTSLGAELSRYKLDVNSATLTKLGSVTMPANVQFAVVHPSGRYMYVVSSDAGSGTLGAKGDKHLLSVLKIDQDTGALQMYGEATILPERPIHVAVDRKGQYVLVAFNQSGTVRSYQITQDGLIGEEVAQKEKIDAGIFTHQVTVTPSNQTVIALGRGNEAVADKPADIGSVSTFAYKNGALSLISKEYFEDGLGPRHLAYHPTNPWVYVGLERGSEVFMYQLKPGGTLSSEPIFRKEAILDPANVHRERQKGGCIQIHPNGKYLYVTNRADGTVKEGGKTIWAGGENNIAVFEIDSKTGEPTLIQHIDTQGIEARTFNIDPSGKLLIVANQKTMLVRDGGTLSTVPANLAIFRIGIDGKLEFIRKYDVNAGQKWLLWSDIMKLQ